MDARQKGNIGECYAAALYQKKGYNLLCTNYRTRLGELDLVLTKNNLVVICEVKTRGARSIALPREWVGLQKQKRIIAATESFLAEHSLTDSIVRFDVAEVFLEDGKASSANIIENAFEIVG